MPSVSGRQHRYFGYLKSHPEDRPKSLSAGQVDEWLHADKGKHFPKARGGATEDKDEDDDLGFSGRKEGGAVSRALHIVREKKDFGGASGFPSNPPYFAREEARGENSRDYGLVATGIPGRTDRHPVDVASGTYVLPADVLSGLGEGNTLAGAAVVDRMLHSMPFGIQAPARGSRGIGIPRPPAPYRERPPAMAEGGVAPGEVPIIIAGGEFLIPPDMVAYHPKLGGGDPKNQDPKHYQDALTRGHEILDAFVKHARNKHIKELSKLPGPKKD